MALSGKLEADFTSFYDAASKAVVSLDGLDKTGKDVTASLTKLAESFSGGPLIQEATLAVEAVTRIGGATALTEDEQQKLNALVTQAIDKYTALGQEAPAAMKDMQAATEGAGGASAIFHNTLGGIIEEVSTMAAGFISAQAAIGLVEKGIDFLVDSFKAYVTAEENVSRLTEALRAQGAVTPEIANHYRDLADSLSRTTRFSEDLYTAAERTFVLIGDVGPTQMQRALQGAADLAIGLGTDLPDAAEKLAKAAEGNVTALRRVGVQIDDARAKAEGLPYVLDQVNKRFGGQAQADMETTGGKLAKVGNEWDKLKENVGKAIAQDPAVQSFLRNANDLLEKQNKATTDAASGWEKYLGWIQKVISPGDYLADSIVGNVQALNDLAAVKDKLGGGIPLPQPDTTFIDRVDAANKAAAEDIRTEMTEAWKAAQEAAKRYAEEVQREMDQISGATLQKQVALLQTAVTRLQAAGPLTAEQLHRVGEEAQKLFLDGAQLTPQLAQLAVQFGHLGDSAQVGVEHFADLGTKINTVTVPAITAFFTESDKVNKQVQTGITDIGKFGEKITVDLGGPLHKMEAQFRANQVALRDFQEGMHAFGAAIGGDVGKAIEQFSSMAGAIKNAHKAFQDMHTAFAGGFNLAGLVTGVGGLLSLASAAVTAGTAIAGLISKVFHLGSAGRDAVVSFADSFGGFDALHEKLSALGDEGEQLWIKLTQGVGRNDPAAAQAAIQAITDALNKQQAASQDTQVQTEAQAAATIETATQASQALDTVSEKLKTSADDWAAWGAAVNGVIDAIAKNVLAMPVPSAPSAAPVPGFATGTGGKFLDFGSGTLALLHGKERVMTEGEGAGGGGGTAIINIDGVKMAEIVVPNMPGVITRYGLA